MLRLNYEKRDLGFSFGLAVAMMVISSLLLTLIFGEAEGWKSWLMQAIYTLLIGAVAPVYAAITKTNPLTAMKLNVRPRWAHISWGLAANVFLIFGMMPLNSMLMDAIQAMGLSRPAVNLPEDITGLIIVGAILPAFCEEAVFRGTVAQSVSSMRNRLGAITVCGGLFALFHANPAQTIHQFVLGAFLALLVLRSGSLWTGIAVHLFNNALVVALNFTVLGRDDFWSVSGNTATVLSLLFAGLVGFALCVFGYMRTTRSFWTGSTEDETAKRNTDSFMVLGVAIGVCVLLWVTSLFA